MNAVSYPHNPNLFVLSILLVLIIFLIFRKRCQRAERNTFLPSVELSQETKSGMASVNTLIFGGHGQTALCITRQLIKKGHKVHSIIRDPSQIDELRGLGAFPIVQNIEKATIEDMRASMVNTKSTTVIWSAQAGGRDPQHVQAVDVEGAIRTMDAASEASQFLGQRSRYISVSALDVRDREKVLFPSWYNDADKQLSQKVYSLIKVNLDAKLKADRSLVTENERRKLRYTIIRPSGLLNAAAKSSCEAGKVHIGAQVTREDVAAVVVACIENEGSVGLAFDVVGGETEIKKAVGEVAKDRIDTFEGTY